MLIFILTLHVIYDRLGCKIVSGGGTTRVTCVFSQFTAPGSRLLIHISYSMNAELVLTWLCLADVGGCRQQFWMNALLVSAVAISNPRMSEK